MTILQEAVHQHGFLFCRKQHSPDLIFDQIGAVCIYRLAIAI